MGRLLGNEGGVFINKISAIIQETHRALLPLLPLEDSLRR